MLTHRGFSACVEANGAYLPEYLVSIDEKAARVSCWIPGIEGQTFTVHWCDEGSKVSTCAFIMLDGVVVPGRFLHGEGAASRAGVRVSKTTERPFVFKRVKETSSYVLYNNGPLLTGQWIEVATQEDSKEAGLIILKIKRIKCVAPRAPNPIQFVPSVGTLGMRKQGDLCVGFGEEIETDAQHGATWEVSSYESDKPGIKPSTFVSFAFRYRSPEFLEAQGIASMEQTQPWVAHTRRFTQRAVSLPIRLPMPLDAIDSVSNTPSSSTNSTPLIGHPLMKIGSLPPLTLTREPSLSEMGPPATPASTSSDLNNSPEQLIGQLPRLNSRGSTPLQSESDGESRKTPPVPGDSSPTESEPDKSLGRIGKGKAPVIWRPWIHPNSRPSDPRRTVSWKLPRLTSESGASNRSIRGVERQSPADDNTGSPHAFEGAFIVSLPRPISPRNVHPLSN